MCTHHPKDFNEIKTNILAFCEFYGIPFPTNFSLYSCRTTTIMLMRLSDMTIPEIKNLTRHAKNSTVLDDTYF